jgi:Ca2+-binding RTX toxin-like protein
MASSTLVSIIIDEGLLLDSLPRVGGSLFYVLETAWSSVTERLRDFARSPEFAAKMELAFGQDVNVSELQTAWAAGDFSKLPRIEVRLRSHLNGANGAYAAALDRIFISEEFLNQNAGNMGAASLTARVILEEIGHAVDGRLNESDSPGDEGAIFAALVLGESLDAKTLQALKTEDDTGVINLNGQIVAVEMQNFTGTNGNDNIIGTAGDDTISPLRGKDTVDGGEGNDLLIVDYSSNLYEGTTTYPSGFLGSDKNNPNGAGGWNGWFSAYTRNDGDYDSVNFSNIERFQIKGTNFNDTFDRGGYGVFNIDGGAGTDSIRYADFSSETTGLTVDNSGVTLTQANGNVVKNVEVFTNLWTGTGNDTINYSVGLRNWENINTGAGNDTINTGSGRDTVDGGAGNDLLIVDYSSNLYAGNATYSGGIGSSINPNGFGGWNGYFYAYSRNDGDYDNVTFSNIERFQITGTNFNDTFDRGGYGVFNIDGGTGTDVIRYADLSSETTGLTVDNSGITLTQANGNVVKNVEVFANLWTGTGNDTINYSVGLRNYENINTGAGNDTINTGSGRDTVDGGAGNDLLIVDYSSNLYAGNATYSGGIGSSINPNGFGGWNGYFYAYSRNDGDYDNVTFSNIERFQITGTNFNDTFDRGGYGVFNIDGGTGTDVIRYADLSSETTGLTVDNSGITLTQANGNVVKNVEVFANLWTGTGNDTINYSVGLRNYENINTGAGNDTINTGSGRDTVDGGAGNDLLIVDYSSNLYAGNATYSGGIGSSINPNGFGGWNGYFYAYSRNDGDYDNVTFSNIERFQITGTNFNDSIYTGDGDDIITGGIGNDTLNVRNGNDILIGVDPNSSNPGRGEIDSFTGGLGRDRFILGDVSWLGYDDGDSTLAGNNDYAQISDFNPTDDIIQLQGTSSNYLLTVSGTDTQLYLDKPGSEPDELIAILQNRTGLSLTGSYFNYFSALPNITLAINPASVNEDGTPNLIYTFTRDGSLTNPLTVNYTIGGTATNGTDYGNIGTSVTFTTNSSTATVTVNPTADTVLESDETVDITLGSGTGYTIGTTTAVTGTILNDDLPSITLAVNPLSVNEDGTTNLIYTFTRDGSLTNPLTVNYTIGGTATKGTDYANIGTSVTFAQNSAIATVTVDPKADATVESNETVALTLAPGTGYKIGTTTAVTGTILNDDPAPATALSINDLTVIEGKDTRAILTVSLSSLSSKSISVNYTTTPINATANSDYTHQTGTLTIAANSSIGTIFIPILNDNLNEIDEAFTVTLSNPINATLSADSVGEVIITDTWQSNITRTLPSGVENLRLIGDNPINGTGNASNNVLTGNSANNTLAGLAGNDTYVFTANSPLGLDTISETTTGGIDTLDLSGTNNPIRLNLGSITNQTVVTGNLTLKLSAVDVIENAFGGSGNDRITGNSLSNTLNGGAGNDTLSGGAGNDILTGNQGDDLLVGGVDNDGFNYLTGRAFMASDIGLDTLTDFTPNADKLSLSKTTFSALTSTVGNGFSQATDFAIVEDDALVETSAAFIVYSSNSGSLFYNENGSAIGLGTGAEFAVLVGSPALTASDFTLVA